MKALVENDVSSVQHERTRRRLMEAAGEVFAEHGYRAATTRDICQRAGANPAAINYHFGGKEALYLAVIRESVREAKEKYPATLGLGDDPTPVQRLEAFIRSLMFRLLDQGRPAWQGKLLVREMTDPTSVLDVLVEEMMRPHYELLLAILRELAGPQISEQELARCGTSIVAQCIFYRHAQPVIARINPAQAYSVGDIESLAGHVLRFSLAAIGVGAALAAGACSAGDADS